jgi:apolipoprotein N-acyltransferase
MAESQSPNDDARLVKQAPTGRHPAVAGILSAILLVMAFEPVGAWWLAWVALVPLMIMARSTRRSTRQLALGAWVGGLVYWLSAVEWVRKSDPGAWPGWLALALVLSLFWPAFLLLTRIAVRGLGVPMMLAAPTIWVSLEFFRAYYPLNGFQWFYLAHSQYQQLWLIQFIDLTGAWGLSLLIALGNAWIVSLLTLPLFRPGPAGPRLNPAQIVRTLIFSGLLVSGLIYSAARLGSARFEPGPKLVLLQSDIPQDFNRPRPANKVLETFRGLLQEAMDETGDERPDLIVWPETMFPFPWSEIDQGLSDAELQRQIHRFNPEGTPEYYRERKVFVAKLLHEWTDRMGVPMLVGIDRQEFRLNGLGRYNSVMLFEPGSEKTQFYRKLHLVPFGEYVPLVQSVPFILRFTPFDAEHLPSLDPSPETSVLKLGDHTIATVICFEDSVPQVARRVMLAGTRQPDLLLNISNDGWFRGTAAHRLHLANSVLRAVEFRVPVARAVNTGISAFIDGNGRVSAELREANEAVLVGQVQLDPRTSFYLETGPWLGWLCAAFTFAMLPLAAIRSIQRRRASVNSGATGAELSKPSAANLPPAGT